MFYTLRDVLVIVSGWVIRGLFLKSGLVQISGVS